MLWRIVSMALGLASLMACSLEASKSPETSERMSKLEARLEGIEAQKATAPTEVRGHNFLANGDFANDLEGWTVKIDSETVDNTKLELLTVGSGLRVVQNAKGYRTDVRSNEVIHLNPEARYVLQASVRWLGEGSEGDYSFHFTLENNSLTAVNMPFSPGVNDHGWHHHSFAFGRGTSIPITSDTVLLKDLQVRLNIASGDKPGDRVFQLRDIAIYERLWEPTEFKTAALHCYWNGLTYGDCRSDDSVDGKHTRLVGFKLADKPLFSEPSKELVTWRISGMDPNREPHCTMTVWNDYDVKNYYIKADAGDAGLSWYCIDNSDQSVTTSDKCPGWQTWVCIY